MNEAAFAVIKRCAERSHAGTSSFGEVVGELAGAGVESYYADYRDGRTIYYLGDGACCSLVLPTPALAVPELFDAAAVQAAIRGAQRGEVKYPEFMALSMAAGCVGYFVWIAGRHVTYFGRRGEQHIERFPD